MLGIFAWTEGSSNGVIMFDVNKRIILANPAAQRMTGFPGEGFYLSELYKLFSAIGLAQKISDLLTSGTASHFQEVTVVKFTYEMFIVPIRDYEQKLIGGAILIHDISYFEELNRRQREFLNLASHQLRTPLTGIEWTIDLFLKKEKLTDGGKSYLQDIRFSAKRLNALVKLLLNASRIEGGQVEVVPESMDIVGLMNEYFREYQALFEKKNLTFLFSHPENLAAFTDKNLFGHILQNLVGNAIEYTPAGGKIEVLVEKKPDTFIFTVRDTGIGIPKKDQARVFEKFFRSSTAVHTKPDGAGLGLYIVFEAIKLLGGKVWFESPSYAKASEGKEEGKGTTFYVELPLQVQAKEGKKHLADHPFE